MATFNFVSQKSVSLLNSELCSQLTTNPGNTCTHNHTGTSAATPIAVGIIALALEANPKLTWRDIQHLAVWTADPTPSLLQRNKEWQMNRAGFLYHPKLGFGLMNALKFVQTAEKWKTVPQQQICVTEYGNYKTKSFFNSTDGVIKFETDGCNNDSNYVTFIERVQLITSIKSDFRGHVSLWLESPEGTKSQILPSRPVDLTDEGFQEWPLSTVHMWGENPKGVWTLYIQNANQWEMLSSSIHIESIKLVLYGTREAPEHYSEPREYGLALGFLEKEQNLDKEPMEKFDRKYSFELTTNPGNTCTHNHTGTSAATPIAVGIIALALEANPKLTWRDIQHLAVWTADPTPSLLQRNKEWQMNRAGFLYHPKLGFGLMNALKFVQTAEKWKTVPQQQICVTEYGNYKTKSFFNSTDGVIKFETDGCNNDSNYVTFIERVQLITSIKSDFRGHVSLWLESPEGTKSQILPSRPVDLTDEGFQEWPLSTVHMWGENPKGVWTLYIQNANQWEMLSSSIHIESIKLVLYGTREAPEHYSEPREYGLALGFLEKEQNLDKEPMEKFDRKYSFEEMLERLNSANSNIRNTLGI